MKKKTSAALCLSCVSGAVTAVCLVLAANLYWSASPSSPEGEVILFKRVVPQPYGGMFWLSIKPLLGACLLASAWSLWRLVRAWREKLQPGLCPSCGYDLRAMPSRCPECGHAPAGEAKT